MKNIFLLIMLMLTIGSAQAQLIKEKEPIDPKYLAGAVPEVDGKVVFSHDIVLDKTANADTLCRQVRRWISQYYNRESVLKRSSMANDTEHHHLEVGIVEYITFKDLLLVLDRTQIIYLLSVDVKDNQVSLRMSDISYYYEEERDAIKYTAEEWITDKASIRKSGDKFVKGHGKFRTNTIDLFQRICNELEFCINDQQ